MGREFAIKSAPLAGVMLIDASAGTGKTYTISALVVRLLLEKGFSIDEVLVVTYTDAAVDDLKTRVRQKIIEGIAAFTKGVSDDVFLSELLAAVSDHPEALHRLTIALRNFDEAAIFTIHGFCRRVLNEHSLESGVLFDSELNTDQHDLLREISEDFFRLNFYGASSLLAAACFKDFAPDNLLKKLGNIHAREDVRIIPEVDGARCLRELAGVEREYQQFFEEFASRWPGKRALIAEILLTSAALNRTKYNQKSIPGWLAALDQLAAMATPPVLLFKEFVKFTSSSIAAAAKKGKTPPVDDLFALCDKLHSIWQQLTALLADYRRFLEAEFYAYMGQELKSRKAAAGIHSFDDLLTDLHQALLGEGGADLVRLLNVKYRAAMIDEFQDTDPVQYEIFSRIFTAPGALLYLIGDPKQAIYSFRGADIFAYIRAVREVGNRYTLGENWRSVPRLVVAVNAVFNGSGSPFVFDEIIFNPARAAVKEQQLLMIDDVAAEPFQLWAFQRDGGGSGAVKLLNKDDARHLVLSRQTSEVVRLLSLSGAGRATVGGRPLTSGDLAILVRTNHEARLVQESLTKVGVASAINGSESLFASREAVELRIVLQAMVDGGDSRRIRAALATRLLGGDGRFLDLFAEGELLVEWLGKFRRYQELWAEAGFAGMFGSFLEEEGVRARLLLLTTGERALTNILHLVETLHLAGEEQSLGMAGLVKYLSERIAAIDEQPDNEQQLRLESDADLVQIVTIHKAKGLQYPVVFCPFCWEGSRLADKRNKNKSVLFHDPEDHGELILDIGSTDINTNRLYAIREELAENLRLLYVALTRAAQCCYLAWGPFSGSGTSALAYLLHGGVAGSGGGGPWVAVDYMKTLSDGDIAADLECLVERSAGAISLDFITGSSASELFDMAGDQDQLSCRQFNGSPKMNWRISSFSALSRKLPASHQSSRKVAEEDGGGDRSEPSFAEFVDFPRGAGPGTFLHSILEELDFRCHDQGGLSTFLQERLVAAGYEADWAPTLADMIDNLLNTPLDPVVDPELILANVDKSARLNELEFYFPLADFNPAGLDELLTDWSISGWTPEKIRGFMKGYIDLVFCHDEKFYIVDWKSNFLGKDLEQYYPDNLHQVMADEHYCLQYLIYTVALHRYLQRRMPGYSYEENFGGVFYIFLRGLGHRVGVDSGVFRDKPPFSLVRELSDLFGG